MSNLRSTLCLIKKSTLDERSLHPVGKRPQHPRIHRHEKTRRRPTRVRQGTTHYYSSFFSPRSSPVYP